MPELAIDEAALFEKAKGNSAEARSALFALHRLRLQQMVALRLDRRVQGRLDPADVLQEVYLEYERRFADYATQPAVPLFLWLRQLTAQKLIDLHRQHLGAQARDVRMEISLDRGPIPAASSAALAAQLVGRLTSASKAIHRVELRLQVETALNALDPTDREILTLRHFEMLSNSETAEILGLSKTAASNRYIRALQRIKEHLPKDN